MSSAAIFVWRCKDNFCDVKSVSLGGKPSLKGSTLTGKNLLLREQMLSFKM